METLPTSRRPLVGHSNSTFTTHSSRPISRCSMTLPIVPMLPSLSTGHGVRRRFQTGWAMAVFEYPNAVAVRDTFLRYGVRYLFFGKSGAILLGFSDTTQDVDLFVDKEPPNGGHLVAALRELGFPLTEQQAQDIIGGKDFVQLRTGPFDLDLVFAPDGVEHFTDAWQRHVER